MADKAYVKLKYFSQHALTSGTVTDYHVYAGNGMFDPDITSTGGQPTGFDQWNAFFDRYVVIGSKIVVNFENTGATSPATFYIYPSRDNQDPIATGAVDPMELPNSRWKTAGTRTGGSMAFVRLKNYMTSAKMFGVSKSHVKDTDGYGATFSANPVANQGLWYWVLGTVAMSGTAGGWVSVAITYYALLRKQKEIIISDD